MSSEEHRRHEENVAPYLLGALHEMERQAFELHLEACAECREEVERLRPAAEALPRSVEPLAPPPGLKRALMEVVEREADVAPASPRLVERIRSLLAPRPMLAWAGAAAVLAAGIVTGFAIGGGASDDGTRTVSASVDERRAPSASASLVLPEGGEKGGILRVRGLPRPGSRRVYQVWVRRDGEVLPGPTFDVTPAGGGAAAVPSGLQSANAVVVTRERRGGATIPSERPVLVVRI
jgi:anti-sigma-K factor RskA